MDPDEQEPMIKAIINIFRIPELRNRVLFTLGMLVVYRLGFWIPLPGVDQNAIAEAAKTATEGGTGFGKIIQYAAIFTGGSFSQSTIFGLGIMPYITAAIIFQLLQTAVPRLQELKKEGASGQQKITEWTRYATIVMCLVQSTMWLKFMAGASPPMVEPAFLAPGNILLYYLAGFTGLTAGSMFLMWLGEQIDKYGIGNGVSLILTAGIISRMPYALEYLSSHFSGSQQDAQPGDLGVMSIIFLAGAFVFVARARGRSRQCGRAQSPERDFLCCRKPRARRHPGGEGGERTSRLFRRLRKSRQCPAGAEPFGRGGGRVSKGHHARIR